MAATKNDIIDKLRQDILLMEGFRALELGASSDFKLGPIEAGFPNGVFPTGTIHEFISLSPEETAACGGFISGLIKTLLTNGGACLWISASRRIYPSALKQFGVAPDRVIFVDVSYVKDVLWVTEEALKCEGVTVVVCETRELTFMESRRLQLAVEKSHVTGFVLRKDAKTVNTTACIARWKITPVRSKLRTGMPGVGFPRWRVELLRVRNGNPGSWIVEWKNRNFMPVIEQGEKEFKKRYA